MTKEQPRQNTRQQPGRRYYYDNSIVVWGLRAAVMENNDGSWVWFFEDRNAPVQGLQPLRSVRTAEEEIRAAVPASWVAARKTTKKARLDDEIANAERKLATLRAQRESIDADL